ncbi:MAG TPA: hypothetical protein PLP33_27865 [Leptospiraceae bacterium]|nr:hypothetical protein [Leptospiraceae bacterium]
MAITSDKVRNSSDHLTDLDKALLITWFRQSDVYRNNALVFSSTLVSRIDSAEGTVKARIINAVIKEIDKLGVGEVEIRGDKDAVWWNQSKERQALLMTAFLTLYDDIVDGAGSILEGYIPGLGIYGVASVGQRPQYIAVGGVAIRYNNVCCAVYPYCECKATIYRVK